MRYLIDTNVLSELRKGARADAAVREWFADSSRGELYLSVLTLGEIRSGIERIRSRDVAAAEALDSWLSRVTTEYSDRILPVDEAVAEAWGRFHPGRPVPVIDGLLAATALVHDLVLVTRNDSDVRSTGVRWLNPFSGMNG
ncbi:MAG: type II toxin-antitoxin system VapC family toxin [Verrucomicrobiales bacterium]|nr:type II toxin-antitoxin system VapC family toxin [Verrucomicrobiales bacterium]